MCRLSRCNGPALKHHVRLDWPSGSRNHGESEPAERRDFSRGEPIDAEKMVSASGRLPREGFMIHEAHALSYRKRRGKKATDLFS